ncbi:MAG: hypothetical protein PHC83_08755 [Bacteroidales bacterium]|nr:hypothetical protein [Bacteroidales bacterium]
MKDVVLTRHSLQRAKERANIKGVKKIQRMAALAIERGIGTSSAPNKLKTILQRCQNNHGGIALIYQSYIFIYNKHSIFFFFNRKQWLKNFS